MTFVKKINKALTHGMQRYALRYNLTEDVEFSFTSVYADAYHFKNEWNNKA